MGYSCEDHNNMAYTSFLEQISDRGLYEKPFQQKGERKSYISTQHKGVSIIGGKNEEYETFFGANLRVDTC